MSVRILALTLLIGVTGCASLFESEYQRDYKQYHAPIPEGMTIEQALVTVGRPPNTITLNTSNGTCELWPTKPLYFYYRIFCGGSYRTRSFAAKEIYDAYKRNQIAADEQWGKSKFFVNGLIEGIGKDILGTPYLTLCTNEYGGCDKDNSFGTVQCMFRREDTRRLASVNKNEMAVLRCERAGFLIMNVILNNCSFFDGVPSKPATAAGQP